MAKINPSATPEAVTAVNGAAKRTITLSFDDKYKELYDQIVKAAEADERAISQYLLRFLRNNHGSIPTINKV